MYPDLRTGRGWRRCWTTCARGTPWSSSRWTGWAGRCRRRGRRRASSPVRPGRASARRAVGERPVQHPVQLPVGVLVQTACGVDRRAQPASDL